VLICFAFAILVTSDIASVSTTETTGLIWYSQAAVSSPLSNQENFVVESLFIALTSDGNAVVEYDLRLPKLVVQRTNIELIGNTINDLAVSDYLDNPLFFSLDENRGKVSINSSRVTNLLISYSTPDLVDKQDRVWTFSVDSPVSFSLKMPPESQIVKLGGSNSTSSVRRILQEDLLTFEPGKNQISYIIGPQGTYAETNAVIKSAELSMEDARKNFPGINLTGSQDLLQQATVSKLNGRNLDAAKYAIESNNIVQNTIQDYESSQATINEAEHELDKLQEAGVEKKYHLESLLNEANAQFYNGQYDLARLSAEDLIIQLSQSQEYSIVKSPPSLSRNEEYGNYQWSAITYVIPGVLIALVLIILLLVRKTHYHRSLSRILRRRHNDQVNERMPVSSSRTVSRSPSRALITSDPSSHSAPTEANESPTQPVRFSEPTLDETSSMTSSSSTPSSSLPSTSSQTSRLNQAVKQILSERPHLHLEDEQLLELLAEKQGAAYESEIRNKLLLPKTSVWRLVRRLEREGLIDVIKVDSQNLIKLRL
jgi:uncharacterized membrane protein